MNDKCVTLKLVQFCEYFDLVTAVVVVVALPRAVPILIAHLNLIERQKLQKRKNFNTTITISTDTHGDPFVSSVQLIPSMRT